MPLWEMLVGVRGCGGVEGLGRRTRSGRCRRLGLLVGVVERGVGEGLAEDVWIPGVYVTVEVYHGDLTPSLIGGPQGRECRCVVASECEDPGRFGEG